MKGKIKILAVFLSLVFSTSLYAAYPSTPFAPGDTLDPGCAPGSSNCFVQDVPAGSTSQVQFNNAGAFGADSNFVWDNTNKRFGIATTAPSAQLSVNNEAGKTAFVIGSSTATSFIVDSLGRVGIGTTSPISALSVSGSINSTGVLMQNGVQVIYLPSQTFPGTIYFGDGGASLTHSVLAEGYNNTAVGIAALFGNTTGSNNVAIGKNALNLNTTGSNNAAFGSLALGNNTSGSFNSALSPFSLESNTTGSNSVAVGYESLQSSTGSNNTGVGTYSLLSNTLGQNNTTLGFKAGSNLTTASSSIIIGANVSAPSNTLDGQLNIGNLIYGTGLYNNTSVSSAPAGGNVGIGTTTPTYTLSVEGTTSAMSVRAGDFVATTTATSTLTGGLSTNLLNVTSGTASSTFANGINVTAGCFAVNGTCVGGGGSFTNTLANGGTATTTFYNGGVIFSDGSKLTQSSSAANFFWDETNKRLGLGTSSPSAILSVNNTAGATAFAIGSSTGTSFIVDSLGRVGIGTTSPWATFAINPIAGQASNQFVIGSSTATSFLVNNSGFIGIGTTSPYAKLSVVGETVSSYFTATTTTATSTFAGGLNVDSGSLLHDFSTGVTSIDNLQVGSASFQADSGIVSWIDMPVSSSVSAATVESYTAGLDGNPLLTVYGTADGSGNVTNTGVGIGTTTPYARLSVNNTAGVPAFAIGSSTATSLLVNSLGNTGLGTTSINQRLVVQGGVCVTSGNPCPSEVSGKIVAQGLIVQSAFDVAETYPTKDSSLGSGDIVTVDIANPVFVLKASGQNNTSPIGVVSTAPGLSLGGSNDELYSKERKVPVALSGRVPVKVSLEGGSIKVGDYLALSSQAGVAKRATESGQVVGIALENYDNSSASSTVLVFIRTGYQIITITTASSTPSSIGGSLFADLVTAFQTWFATVKEWTMDKLSVTTVYVKSGIEMIDADTGEVYCVKIKSGALTQTKGSCDSLVTGGSSSGGSNNTGGGGGTGTTTPTDNGTSTTTPESSGGSATTSPSSIDINSGDSSTQTETVSPPTEQTPTTPPSDNTTNSQ